MAKHGSAPARRGSTGVARRDPGGVVVNGVSSDEEPSVEWGWHGHYPNAARVGGFITTAVLLVMFIGNHEGRQEDIWLGVLALGFLALTVGSMIRARSSWRR